MRGHEDILLVAAQKEPEQQFASSCSSAVLEPSSQRPFWQLSGARCPGRLHARKPLRRSAPSRTSAVLEPPDQPPDQPSKNQPVLTVDSLTVSLGGAQVVQEASCTVYPGEILGIVGQSGSGKSTFLKAIAHLLPAQGLVETGSVTFLGQDITHVSESCMQSLRGSQMAYLFQNGLLSLDPLFTINQQFDEILATQGASLRLAAHQKRINSLKDSPCIPSLRYKEQLLRQMGIEDPQRVLASLPAQLSGGQCQRCVLAFALAGTPRLLLADEPTSALDIQAQEQVGALLKQLNQEEGMAIVLVGHDIRFVASLANRIIVMHDGRFIEQAPTSDMLEHPQQPYTQKLIASIPCSTKTFIAKEAGQ